MKKPAQSTLITHSHNARDVVLGNYSWLGINLCCWTERKEKPEEHKPILKDNIRNELATRRVLQEKVFLEILQNSQENTCTRVSFLIKLQAWGLQLY